MTRLFFTQPTRRWIIKLTTHLPHESRFYGWLLDQLYPDDLRVTFGPEQGS